MTLLSARRSIFVSLALLAAGLLVVFADSSVEAGQKPGKPTNFQVSKSGTTVTLTWNAPSSGGSVSHYHVRATPTDESKEKYGIKGKGQRVPSETTTATFTGLTDGATYKVKVRAKNEAGKSKFAVKTITIKVYGGGTRPIDQDTWDEISPRD